MKYAFILGHEPTLSTVEIHQVLAQKQLNFEVLELSEQVCLINSQKRLPVQFLMQKLGGTIKIIQIIEEFSDFGQITPEKIITFLPQQQKKLFFGFSLYQLNSKYNLKKFLTKINKLGLSIKKQLRGKGVNSRLVTSRETALSSVIVKKEKLLDQGTDFGLIFAPDKTYLGQTLAIQDWQEQSYRDYHRPKRNIKSGMLPPKLAKIMINLSGAKENEEILDPFCGDGTILQEAILMGYKNLAGNDVSENAVKNTKANLDWLSEEYKINLTKIRLRIFCGNVINLSDHLAKNLLPHIITEPYLGPPLRAKDTEKEIKIIVSELSRLYVEAFREFKKILKKGGRIVIIFPAFKVGNKVIYLEILDQIKNIGFEIKDLVPNELKKSPVIQISKRGSMIYARPDQRVCREIFVFEVNRD